MKLDEQQRSWMAGDAGPTMQWAMEFNHNLGNFFEAKEMLPVASAHFAPDTRMGGSAMRKLLESLVKDGAAVKVPSYLDPCSVDFERSDELIRNYGFTHKFVDADRYIQKLCRDLGFLPTYSCINYQTITPPLFGQHLAWGDTGAAISANAIFGARTNFEGGPSALACALLGMAPAYGMHLQVNRHANLIIQIDCQPDEIADWGAIAALSGQIETGYETVPVFYGNFKPPTFNMLKQLGVALASYGGHAMFHLVGVTPEAPSIEVACGGKQPRQEHILTRSDLNRVYANQNIENNAVDLVVFAAPQLSIDEVKQIADGLSGRKVHDNTKLIIAVDPQVKQQADNAGLSKQLNALGAEFTKGTCFYPEAPLIRQVTGWRTLVTNSSKLVNTLSSAGYSCAIQRLNRCLDAAVTGRLS